MTLKKHWKTVFSLESRDPAHINIKELRAARIYARRRAREALRNRHGARVVLLIDSRAAAGALAHGRSPSRALNGGLRTLLPLLLAADLTLCPLWIPSEANPSDAPSRLRKVWQWRAEVVAALQERKAWRRHEKSKRSTRSGNTGQAATERPAPPIEDSDSDNAETLLLDRLENLSLGSIDDGSIDTEGGGE